MAIRKDNSVEGGSRWRVIGMAAVLICVAAIAYFPSLKAGFVWDDDSMLTKNSLIHADNGLYQFWFTTKATDYWPATYTTLWLEWRLWGMNAMGYHATNLALHISEALLLWAILRRLRVPGALLAALVFAVHPVNVESVAWIAQRKNLMAMLFFLLSILFFTRTELSIPPTRGRLYNTGVGRWYWLSLLAFMVALLCKGSVAMLPMVLLGLIAWHRRLRIGDIVRVAPFFIAAATFVLVDIWFQRHGSAASVRNANFVERTLGAGAAVWFYLYKAILPINLIPVYPQWRIRTANPLWWLPAAAAAGTTVALWRCRKRGGRPALFAWAYFCVMLFPALGFTDVYFMRYSLVADHYAHLAIIGAIALASAGLASALGGLSPGLEAAGRVLVVLLVGTLGALTWKQCRIYRDIETYYQTIIERNPMSWMAYNNLGGVLIAKGELPEAITLLKESLRLEPSYSEAYNNLGLALFNSGHKDDAIACYEEALRLDPRSPEAQFDLGLSLVEAGRTEEGIAHYKEALRIKPDYADPHNGLGLAFAGAGLLPEAIMHYDEALKIDPSNAAVHYNLGMAHFASGQMDEAIADYQQAVRLKPDHADAHNNLGIALASANRLGEAVVQFQEALRTKPSDSSFHKNLGLALQDEGRTAEAQAQFEAAAQLQADRQEGSR
jgi:protein O-mannosyl-transferase